MIALLNKKKLLQWSELPDISVTGLAEEIHLGGRNMRTYIVRYVDRNGKKRVESHYRLYKPGDGYLVSEEEEDIKQLLLKALAYNN